MADSTFSLKTIDGSTISVFMSFGLLNVLVKIIKDPENVTMLPFLHELRDEVLTALVQTRSPTGMIMGEPNKLENMALDPATIIELLAWVEDHVLSFFTEQAVRLQKINQKYEKVMEGLKPSTVG